MLSAEFSRVSFGVRRLAAALGKREAPSAHSKQAARHKPNNLPAFPTKNPSSKTLPSSASARKPAADDTGICNTEDQPARTPGR